MISTLKLKIVFSFIIRFRQWSISDHLIRKYTMSLFYDIYDAGIIHIIREEKHVLKSLESINNKKRLNKCYLYFFMCPYLLNSVKRSRLFMVILVISCKTFNLSLYILYTLYSIVLSRLIIFYILRIKNTYSMKIHFQNNFSFYTFRYPQRKIFSFILEKQSLVFYYFNITMYACYH